MATITQQICEQCGSEEMTMQDQGRSTECLCCDECGHEQRVECDGELCDTCGQSGVEIARTKRGQTICVACDWDMRMEAAERD